jgi:hypothetical protein
MTEENRKGRLYKVYHIHEKGKPELNDGYIGITKRTIRHRFGQHKSSTRPTGFKIRELGVENVMVTILAYLPKYEASMMERQLRPINNTGWNLDAGGLYGLTASRFNKGHEPHNLGKGEKYKLISPEGDVFYPEVFTVWCREHGLTPQNIRKVAKGLRKHSKGWRAEKITG